jgi:signal transduction histidine kinase
MEHETDEVTLAKVAELEALARDKDRFLAGVAHDIGNHLTAIMMTQELLLEHLELLHLPKDYVNSLKASARAAQRIRSLSQQLLDISRLKGGELQPQVGPLYIESEINVAVSEVSYECTKKGLEIKTEKVDEETIVWVDQNFLNRILVNLLFNAIKYTDTGIVTVSVEHTDTAVTVRIQDTGVGIPPDLLEHIFDQFKQIDGRRGGVGLGLYLSRELARKMGGEITVESALGQGSTFTLTLPPPPSD